MCVGFDLFSAERAPAQQLPEVDQQLPKNLPFSAEPIAGVVAERAARRRTTLE
jgi:hypothetical protein